MAWMYISFKQLFTPASKRDQQLYETGVCRCMYVTSIHESTVFSLVPGYAYLTVVSEYRNCITKPIKILIVMEFVCI